MPILSLVSNSGLTAYNNRLAKVLSAYSNRGYSGKDPLWHATTAWVTATSLENVSSRMIVDILLAGPGGSGSAGSTGGVVCGGGGGAGGYLYASGVEIPNATAYGQAGPSGLILNVGIAKYMSVDKESGKRGFDTYIWGLPFRAFAGAGGSGGDKPANSADYGGQGPGLVGYYSGNPTYQGFVGSGSAGGNSPSIYGYNDFTPGQGFNGGSFNSFGGGYGASGGGGGAGEIGGEAPGASPYSDGGRGGNGVNLSFTGWGTQPFGGGGGGSASSGAGGAGGSSSGGAGGSGPAPSDGTWATQYGAGGGGCGRPGFGGRGGNGFIMLKYPMYYANAVFKNVGYSVNAQRDDLVMEYMESGGYRCFKFRPGLGAVANITTDINMQFAEGYLYLPNRINFVIDEATGLSGRAHRINYRTADGITTFDQSYFPNPTSFGPFSTNGWGISLNEDSPTDSASSYYSWLSYPNNLSDFANIGTSDFTLQAYVKKTGIFSGSGQYARIQPILYLEYANGNTMTFGNFYSPGGNAFGYSSSGSGGPITGDTAASDNVWYKLRIQRNLGVVSVFVNDVRTGIGADATDYSGTPTKVFIGYNDYAVSWDVDAFVGQISGLVFRKVTTPVFDLRNSNNFRNVLNAQTVIARNRNAAGSGGDTPRPSCFITGSLDTYSSNNFPSNDKVSSIYFNGQAVVNTSITWDGYYPNGVINTQPTYVFCANTGDFCVDGWAYPTTNTAAQILFNIGNNDEDYFTIYTDPSSRRLAFVASRATPATTLYGPSGGVMSNCWTHFAVQRESGVVKVFTNGQLGDTQTGTGAATYSFNDATLYPSIGGKHSGTSTEFTGYTSQFRYSRFARSLYSGSSYTVPGGKVTADSASLFITGYAGGSAGPPVWDATQKNNFEQAGNWNTVTTSPVNASINSGAVRFATSASSKFPNQYNNNGGLYSAGLGHYIRFTGLNNQRNFKFGTADFCVEGWWTADYVPSQQTLIDFRELTTDIAFAIKIDTSNRILLVVVNTTRITSAPITLGTPVHIAVERVSGVTSLYINGVRSGVTYADTNSYIARPTRPDLFTDGTSEASESFIGSMNMLRVTKDYPRYSANFSTGPTAIFDTIGLNQTFPPYI
jgi:hypothetical protein